MKQAAVATLNNFWRQIKSTGRKVANFLLNECVAADIVVIGGFAICLL